jgi:hypothetical protein
MGSITTLKKNSLATLGVENHDKLTDYTSALYRHRAAAHDIETEMYRRMIELEQTTLEALAAIAVGE